MERFLSIQNHWMWAIIIIFIGHYKSKRRTKVQSNSTSNALDVIVFNTLIHIGIPPLLTWYAIMHQQQKSGTYGIMESARYHRACWLYSIENLISCTKNQWGSLQGVKLYMIWISKFWDPSGGYRASGPEKKASTL